MRFLLTFLAVRMTRCCAIQGLSELLLLPTRVRSELGICIRKRPVHISDSWKKVKIHAIELKLRSI
jgi:hypothetical protein